jgi:hypothetical protein
LRQTWRAAAWQRVPRSALVLVLVLARVLLEQRWAERRVLAWAGPVPQPPGWGWGRQGPALVRGLRQPGRSALGLVLPGWALVPVLRRRAQLARAQRQVAVPLAQVRQALGLAFALRAHQCQAALGLAQVRAFSQPRPVRSWIGHG